MSDTLFMIAMVGIGAFVVGWGMFRPNAEPGDDSWSDGDDSDGGDGD